MQRTLNSKGLRGLGALGLLLLAGCGGGSGGGADAGSPLVLEVQVTVPGPAGNPTVVSLWSEGQIVGPGAVANVPLNGEVRFRFAGPVDAVSLPTAGAATGSINITTDDGVTTTPALGTFVVDDDPALPPGNRRRVRFVPQIPPSGGGTAAYLASSTYTVVVPRGGLGGPSVTVGGAALTNEVANAAFVTCDPQTQSQGAVGCFNDPVPGPAFLLQPGGLIAGSGAAVAASDTAASAPVLAPDVFFDPVAQEHRLTLFASEPLFPEGLTLDAVRLVNVATGAQVPGTLRFFQAGTSQAGAQGARLDYVAAEALWPGVTYELMVTAAVQDFGGQPLESAPPGGAAQRFFATSDVPRCASTIVLDFSDPATFPETNGAITHAPQSGAVRATFPEELIGNGSYGPMEFGPGMHSLDTGLAPEPPGQSEGRFDASYVHVRTGATVRAFGPWPLHVRAGGEIPGMPGTSVLIEGVVDGSAGMVPYGPYPETGPETQMNGGAGPGPVVSGGLGGVGAGDGGDASQNGTARTPQAAPGFGARATGLPNTGPEAPDHFGGGEGGVGGFRFPAGGLTGELGGLGGAGGSAFTGGDPGGPFGGLPLCAPFVAPVQASAQSTGPTPAFMPPVSVLSAGSGGGGGGDRFGQNGADDQGGAGGGGGGGLRISCLWDLELAAGSTLLAQGAQGSAGNVFFGGAGAGGSGGMIWLQSFADVNVASAAGMLVSRGPGSQSCSEHASGEGGAGLYQLEDLDGVVNTSFPGSSQSGGLNIFALPLPVAVVSQGEARSRWLDSGHGDPRYPASPTTSFVLGTAPGAQLRVEYRGAHAAVSSMGANPEPFTGTGPLAPTGWVPGSDIGQLDGRRFIQVRILTAFAAPPATLAAAALPQATAVSIPIEIPCALTGN